MTIPLPSDEQLTAADPWLAPYVAKITQRLRHTTAYAERIDPHGDIARFALWASAFWTVQVGKRMGVSGLGAACDQNLPGWYVFTGKTTLSMSCSAEKMVRGVTLPLKALKHGDHYKLHVYWNDGEGYRVPHGQPIRCRTTQPRTLTRLYGTRKIHTCGTTKIFACRPPLIYEAHIGMATAEERLVATLNLPAMCCRVSRRLATIPYN